MRKYETLIITKPDLPAEVVTKVKDKVLGIGKRFGGVEIAFQDWGQRKLAYPLNKSNKGTYLYYRYLGTGETVFEIERALKVADEVLRYLTVKLDEKVDPQTFDVEADRKTIYPFNAKPREIPEELRERTDVSDRPEGELDEDTEM